MALASVTAENQALDGLSGGTTNVLAYVQLHTASPSTTGELLGAVVHDPGHDGGNPLRDVLGFDGRHVRHRWRALVVGDCGDHHGRGRSPLAVRILTLPQERLLDEPPRREGDQPRHGEHDRHDRPPAPRDVGGRKEHERVVPQV
jgi:hypothetical protein